MQDDLDASISNERGKIVSLVSRRRTEARLSTRSMADAQAEKLMPIVAEICDELQGMPVERFVSEYLYAWGMARIPTEDPTTSLLYQLYEVECDRRGISDDEIERFDDSLEH